MKRKRVVVAMSGGVDSSVAAARLVEQGYEVIGIHMRLWSSEEEAEGNGCCSIGAAEDCRRICEILDIPFYVVNYRDAFVDKVVRYFEEEYLAGRTPNPCIMCNRTMKYDALLRQARVLDANYLATGHYARVARDPDSGNFCLLEACDRAKDQSYVLYHLDQEQLAHTLFPIGEFASKAEVRSFAAAHGLPVAHKPDSQEICFVPKQGYRAFLHAQLGERIQPGEIVDMAGHTVGTHHGIVDYTVGQRKGIGVNIDGEPAYVVDLDAQYHRVIVGNRRNVLTKGVETGPVHWIDRSRVTAPLRVRCRVRYHAPWVEGTVSLRSDETAVVTFDSPTQSVTPGQAIVFYDGEQVLGGGTIVRRQAAA